jgi:hypothetical protein
MIDLYSEYYNNIYLNNKKDDIKLIQESHDRNSGRFLRMLELFDKIKKDDSLYNSKYIFNYYKLSEVNKKDENYNIFLKELRLNWFKYSGGNKSNKVSLNDALYDYYNNKNEDEEFDDNYHGYSDFVSTCIFCSEDKDIDEKNGICKKCINNMFKKDEEDQYYYSD